MVHDARPPGIEGVQKIRSHVLSLMRDKDDEDDTTTCHDVNADGRHDLFALINADSAAAVASYQPNTIQFPLDDLVDFFPPTFDFGNVNMHSPSIETLINNQMPSWDWSSFANFGPLPPGNDFWFL